MPPKDTLELISLPGRGRAEAIRLMLVFVDRKFTDTRITIAQWKLKKKQEGFDDDTKLPVFKVADKKVIVGVVDICRYISMNFGLYGMSSGEQGAVDKVINELEELNQQLNPIIRATLTKNYEQRKREWNLFKENSLVPKLTEYEEHLTTNLHIVGTRISWADVALIEMLTRFQCCYDSFFLAFFPHLKSYCNRFESLPNIRPYIQSRPEAHF